MFKCIGLVSFETLVLIAALFLFVYTKKNEMSKWLQYLAATVTGFVVVLIIGTIFSCMAFCWMGSRGCGNMKGGHHRWEKRMSGPGCEMKGEENCCSKDGWEGEEEGGFQKEIRIEINEDELGGKDTIEKKVIIKKER